MKKGKIGLMVLAVVFLSVFPTYTGAQSFGLSKVADLKTQIPNQKGNFWGFSLPVISGSNVAFQGYASGPPYYASGIYFFNGTTLKKVGDTNTPIPNGAENFDNFGGQVISGSNVAFWGGGGIDFQGIYFFNGTTLKKVADTNTTIPNGTENFTGFYAPVISGSNVAFRYDGIYLYEGICFFNGTNLSTVADVNTPIPNGTENFDGFYGEVISGSNVAFWGGAGPEDEYGHYPFEGIYFFDGTTLSKVADLNTAIPNGTGNFTGFGWPVISGSNVAFWAAGGYLGNDKWFQGIYFFNGTTLTAVADTNTAIPNGTGNFTGFYGEAISGINVAFSGYGSGQAGIYLAKGGVDLIEIHVSNPPAIAKPGSSFLVWDTTKNEGVVASTKTSTTHYYLSKDTVKGSGDILLTGTRSVPSLAPGESYPPTPTPVTVTIPSNTALGTYYLLACADATKTVSETNETDNCIASSSMVQVTLPDYIETTVSDPPEVVIRGGSFPVTDTTTNQGIVASTKTSITQYYLSLDKVKSSGDKLLKGNRSVPPLAAGASDTPAKPVTVTVPSNTNLGTYYLLACADDTKAVAETNETNNCIYSKSQVHVALPDYVETSVSDPPAVVIRGDTFTVTDTTKNKGIVASTKTSTTQYYLSLDKVKSSGDKLLTGGRSVPVLAAGVTSAGTVTVTVPTATTLGPYYLLACADGTNLVAEANETNNCIASIGTVQINP